MTHRICLCKTRFAFRINTPLHAMEAKSTLRTRSLILFCFCFVIHSCDGWEPAAASYRRFKTMSTTRNNIPLLHVHRWQEI
ncbi:hypothetical protein BC936DRAFT_137901 [Jimgerdemannia flammicorona]|uniref:Uncharacterized protein n=1 Tax=Jimgerdemannia flammicorona TaxID=994334 RepID=A0A433DIR1_9FUNG|nr:hypothetical protein BC936DRAFT_137901 [Jimgerdemannia flammicorona]